MAFGRLGAAHRGDLRPRLEAHAGEPAHGFLCRVPIVGVLRLGFGLGFRFGPRSGSGFRSRLGFRARAIPYPHHLNGLWHSRLRIQ